MLRIFAPKKQIFETPDPHASHVEMYPFTRTNWEQAQIWENLDRDEKQTEATEACALTPQIEEALPFIATKSVDLPVQTITFGIKRFDAIILLARFLGTTLLYVSVAAMCVGAMMSVLFFTVPQIKAAIITHYIWTVGSLTPCSMLLAFYRTIRRYCMLYPA